MEALEQSTREQKRTEEEEMKGVTAISGEALLLGGRIAAARLSTVE